MSEHDETLRKALEENALLRAEREQSLREASSAEFSGRLRWAERIFWLYAMVCVFFGVAAINGFINGHDTKTLIGCAVLFLVVYETTVLLKLWFATANMKLSVLKDVKLLRLEMARLTTAVGVKEPAAPSVKYEPMRGATRWERKLWIVACAFVAMATSSWSSSVSESHDRQLADDSSITLFADGSAMCVAEIEQTGRSLDQRESFPFHAPKDQRIRFLDPQGQELPAEITTTGTQNRYEVQLSERVLVDGKLRHTRVSSIPEAAKFEDEAWIYKGDIEYGGQENQIRMTVYLPEGAKLLSTEPSPVFDFEQDGRKALRFQATRGKNEKFLYTIRYELANGTN